MQKDFNKFLEYLEPRVLAYGYVRFSAAIEIFRRLVVPQALPSPTMSQESLTRPAFMWFNRGKLQAAHR